MALDVLTIPAMSADREHLLSRCASSLLIIYSNLMFLLVPYISILYSTKLLIIDQKNRLCDKIIEAAKCFTLSEHSGLSFSSCGGGSMGLLENTLKALEVHASTLGSCFFTTTQYGSSALTIVIHNSEV